VRDLGAGRMTREAKIDFDVGIDELVAVSEPIKNGGTLCRIHARYDEEAAMAMDRLKTAFEISSVPPVSLSRVVEVL
jgi:thymidine phosphorylase